MGSLDLLGAAFNRELVPRIEGARTVIIPDSWLCKILTALMEYWT